MQLSFNVTGTGTFKGNKFSNPIIGKKEQIETVREIRMEMVCGKHNLSKILQAIDESHPYEEPAWELYALCEKPLRETGQGRILHLSDKISFERLVGQIKHFLGISHVRVAKSITGRNEIGRVALCAGSGGSVLKNVDADVYLTGEMSHHDILAACAKGVHVILCEHSNTERGFLTHLLRKLVSKFPNVDTQIASTDRDPLTIV